MALLRQGWRVVSKNENRLSEIMQNVLCLADLLPLSPQQQEKEVAS